MTEKHFRIHNLRAGALGVSPILLGVAPFGLITGAATASVGIPAVPAVVMSLFVFAGMAQLAAVELLGKNAPLIIIVATALIVNLRFLMYSASLAPHFRCLPLRWRSVLAYLLTDQAYAVSITRFDRDIEEHGRVWFYLGAAVSLWITWQSSFTLGVLVGATIPTGWSLDFAVPLTLLALLPASVRDRATLVTALVACGVSAFSAALPLNLGVIAAVLVGALAGASFESRRDLSAARSPGRVS